MQRFEADSLAEGPFRTMIDGVRVRCSTVELPPTRWKAKFGRMDLSEARKLKTLKTENSRLKMLLSLP